MCFSVACFRFRGPRTLGDQLLVVPDISSSPRWRQARSSPEPGGSGAWPCPLGPWEPCTSFRHASISLLIKWRVHKCYESFLRCPEQRTTDWVTSTTVLEPGSQSPSAGSFLLRLVREDQFQASLLDHLLPVSSSSLLYVCVQISPFIGPVVTVVKAHPNDPS